MNRELIINVSKSEITIALAEDKRLVELGKESVKTGFAVGDIYLGRVRKIMPGLNAAFVNIGHEKRRRKTCSSTRSNSNNPSARPAR